MKTLNHFLSLTPITTNWIKKIMLQPFNTEVEVKIFINYEIFYSGFFWSIFLLQIQREQKKLRLVKNTSKLTKYHGSRVLIHRRIKSHLLIFDSFQALLEWMHANAYFSGKKSTKIHQVTLWSIETMNFVTREEWNIAPVKVFFTFETKLHTFIKFH